MDLGGIKAIILDDPVGISGNVSLETVMNPAVLLGVTGCLIPCMAAIVTLMAARCFDYRCIDTGSFFKDQTALFEDFNCCVKQGGTVSMLAKTPSEDDKGGLIRCLVVHRQANESTKGQTIQQHLFKHWVREIKPLLKHHAFDHHDDGPVAGTSF